MTTIVEATPKCGYCGCMPHQGICPMVKAIEYHENGTVKRVELHGPQPLRADWYQRTLDMVVIGNMPVGARVS